MISSPPTNPITGEVSIGMITLCSTPSDTSLPSLIFFHRPDDRAEVAVCPGERGSADAADQHMVELDGRPNHQVEQVPHNPT